MWYLLYCYQIRQLRIYGTESQIPVFYLIVLYHSDYNNLVKKCHHNCCSLVQLTKLRCWLKVHYSFCHYNRTVLCVQMIPVFCDNHPLIYCQKSKVLIYIVNYHFYIPIVRCITRDNRNNIKSCSVRWKIASYSQISFR